MIVGALSVTETITWGIVYYGFAVFLTPMERGLGFSRVALTGAFSVGLLTAALVGLPVGRWIDRHGARGVMTIGSCAAVALMLAWSRVETLWALYVVWALMGLAMAATLYEPAFAAIVGWFAQHRDRALLTLTLFAGLASTIFVPIETALLARMDWRSTLVTLAIFLAVSTIPIHAFVLRAPPAHGTGGSAVAPPSGHSVHDALRTVVFWVLTVAFIAVLIAGLVSLGLVRGAAQDQARSTLARQADLEVDGQRLLHVPLAAVDADERFHAQVADDDGVHAAADSIESPRWTSGLQS